MADTATITLADFEKVDIRTGRILEAHPFPEARKPAYKLLIDFGALGAFTSSAQLTHRYTTQDLVGPAGGRRREFPAQADRTVQVRGADAWR